MSERHTPETDAQILTFTSISKLKKKFENRTGIVSASFARRLERKRDEAMENLRILAGLVAYGLGQSGEEWSLDAMRQATTAIQKAKALEGEK